MHRLLFAISVMLLTACTGTAAGDPCTPESVPPGGFDSRETYIERASPDCVSRTCLVRGLDGDPSPSCEVDCASEEEIAETVYCSCRCDPQAPGGPCACPEGFECADVGIEGYCVRDTI